MKNEFLEILDRVDDLVYEFFKESDNSFLKEKPEYRFLLLSPLFSNLCPFDLANNIKSFSVLNHENSIKFETLKKSEKICEIIKRLAGTPTYFAASYWSPIDRNRHTISHSKQSNEKNKFHYYRCCALLFYILTHKAPPKFHSAINYISENAARKDGLHSSYSLEVNENSKDKHSWFNIPKSIHNEMMEASGFQNIINDLLEINESVIENSLTVIMENLDYDLVMHELSKYEKFVEDILIRYENFVLPDSLKLYSKYFKKYLNDFFNPKDLNVSKINKFNTKQAFFMASTHVLYNKACPTEMLYAFPVRVDNTCCFLTLGVEKELPVDIMLVISHIIKSVYHHSLDRDYQSLNALERNRIAHGAVHKIRGPLNVLSEFPYTIIETLQQNLNSNEYNKIETPIKIANEMFMNSLDNINIGLKSLEKFIDIEEEGYFYLIKIVNNAIETYLKLNIFLLQEISITGNRTLSMQIFGIDSQIQFIFEELISNSIRAFKHYKIFKEKKLIININVKQLDNYTIVDFTDNGIGVEPDKKNLIFSSGFRGKDSGGSGKGLFLCKLFLNRYKHEISECGKYGSGAHFKIEFFNHKKS